MTDLYPDISDETIKQDILDTEKEILQMMKEITVYEMLGDKLSMFKASARKTGIEDRRRFIAKLENILIERGPK